ncbi:MAG: DivIVA domain-containing protein [Actinomycetota bacterium]
MASDARAEFDPKEIARAAFPTAFRGYDQDAVRRYLSRLATAISRAQQLGLLGPVEQSQEAANREAELEIEASELRARIDELEDLLRSNPVDQGPMALATRDLDEAEMIELLGHETARILEQARSAAADIVHRSEAEAEAVKEQSELDIKGMLDEAEDTLTGARLEAEDGLAAARMEAEEIRASASADAKRSQTRSKAEAKRTRELAKAQAEEILAEATSKVDEEIAGARGRAELVVADAEALREEVLGDLVRRRRLYREQLGRMTKARDRLGHSLTMARSELDTVAGDLADTEASILELDDMDDESRPDDGDGEEVQRLIAQIAAARGSATGVDDGDEIDDEPGGGALVELPAGDEDAEQLQVEYLSVDGPSGNGGIDATADDDGLMALKLGPGSNGDGGTTANGADPLESTGGAVALATGVDTEVDYEEETGSEVIDLIDDDLTLDLSDMPVLGATAGTMHRAATRGDLPRSTPFAGTLPAAFEGRDAALGQALPGFRRKLKRAVNDDQSHVLDRLRAGRGAVHVDQLPKAVEQLDRYLEALRPALFDVVRSGAELLNSTEVSTAGVENLCLQLGRHIVECLRAPTVEAIEALVDDDREAILDPVRATYRDFRNSVLPDLIEDAMHEAFALGLYGAIAEDEFVVWLADPRLDLDPICEENSASASLAKGTLFPSGHARPLSMPGCRCLAVPAR